MSDAIDTETISYTYDSELEEDEYEVEKILKHRVTRHGTVRTSLKYQLDFFASVPDNFFCLNRNKRPSIT